MNLFYLHEDTEQSVRWHVNSHVVKIILEAADLCSYALYHYLDDKAPKGICPRRTRHLHHGCTKWVQETRSNYLWTIDYLQYLFKEKIRRYGTVHAYERQGMDKIFLEYAESIPNGPLTPHYLALKEYHYLKCSDRCLSYRLYYIFDKQHLAKWRSPASRPDWYNWDYAFSHLPFPKFSRIPLFKYRRVNISKI